MATIEYESTCTINAPPSTVWTILTNGSGYGEWNPEIIGIDGRLVLGLFVGQRTFTVNPVAGGSEFRLHLRMSGPLAGPIGKSVGDRQPEVESFAAGLKARAERA